ncbi:RNA 2',3'-cyclic phosphodiesterase [Fictibacillus phosphorivorans]|uniref:RNA 2',3'-cyclic phosphodiesterase n=1 Tax=Fictibacillus phosphorivorans TaxID=1221500 RepID=UPI00129380D0|nr:RNA 2',3'-cyclic phosphodiesterase [Fictibacillus phosphorivorans]MQR95222.1 RNA 2',3'-cyclic phosphodiesterase [Fictibacillus phosphorivorans]
MQRHYFLAVKLPDETKTKLANICNPLSNEHHFKTWVHPDDYHITLAFLGAASSVKIETLHKLLNERMMSKKESPFSLSVNHFGFFGNEHHPRIFWAGVEEEHCLYTLQKQVAYVCETVGFQLDKRPYSPHITLARKHIESVHHLVDSQKWWKQYGENIRFQADQFVLYETHIEKQPKYQVIHSYSI